MNHLFNKLCRKLHMIWAITLMLFASSVLNAQTTKVTGRIIDEKGEAIIGAQVSVKGSKSGTASDIDGNFTLTANSQDILKISYIGYESIEIPVKQVLTKKAITLSEQAMNLDEVVVVGYGEFSRRTITSSLSKLDGKAIQNTPISSPYEAMKGRIPGVQIVQTNNTPGGGFSIKIRGGSSITQSNSPLVLVDGVERGMSELNPNDISSIEVLKDAASTAIYGARGSNGVILITTSKGGYDRKLRVTFESNIAYQEAETLRDYMGAEDYINTLRPAIANSPSPQWNKNPGYSVSSGNSGSSIYSTRYYNAGDVIPEGWKTMTDPIDSSKQLMFCDTDWQGLMFKSSTWQNYYASVDGGNSNLRYNGSVGYTNDAGIGIATGFKRFSLKSNTEAKINNKITANFNISFQRTSSDAYASQRNAIVRGLSACPTQIVYNEDGTPALGYNESSQTPIYYTYYSDNSDISKYLSLAGGLKWEIMKGWVANVTGSYYDTNEKIDTFMRANYYSESREATSTFDETTRWKMEAYSQYDKSFLEKHNFNIMGGYSYQKRKYDMTYAYGTGGSSDKIITIDASSETKGSSTQNEDVQIGFFGRMNYDFMKKYLLTLTARYDASSKFASGHRWGFFPGMSAGWIVTEEPWMKNVKYIDYLKLRMSYGKTGNNNIGVNDALGKYTATYKYDDNAAIRGSIMANKNLSWETTTQFDIGFETGLLKNRIYLSADFYNKETKNLLYDMSLPNTSGYSSVTTNLGTVRFWGLEFDLTTHNIEHKDFNWESHFTFSLSKNKVIKLPKNGLEKNRTGTDSYPIYSNGDGTYFGGLAEGEPLYRFYGYKAIGIFQTDEEAAKAPYDQLARGFNYKDGTTVAGRKFAGDYNWADRNNDGIITKGQDLYCLGVTQPWGTGGIGNTFRYKDLTLDIYLDYALGHSIHDDAFGRNFYATFSCNYALAKDVDKCWKQAGDDTRYAKFWANDSGAGQDNFNRDSNIFTHKGDYLCIRDISLSYNIPSRIIARYGAQSLQFTLSASNLYYFTALKGISPEIGTSSTYSTSYNAYPPTRRISFGIKLTL